jgi:hypothetical protein
MGLFGTARPVPWFFRQALFANGNCTTGFVSPQFHLVFDDHFHTVYGDGEGKLITDAICNLLWKNDQELFMLKTSIAQMDH